MRICTTTLILAAVSALLVACDNQPVVLEEIDPALTYDDLAGTRWQLNDLVALGGYVFTPDDSSRYTLIFEADGRLRGTSDCNTITGQWQVAESLQVSQFSTTRSLCQPGSLHNFYSLYLRDITGVERVDDGIVLHTNTEEVRLTFSQQP